MAAADSVNLDSLLDGSKLHAALLADRNRCEDEDLKVMWYHGKMSRACAEKLLFEAMENAPNQNLDGMFLVRGVSRSDKDYSLSFVHNRRCYHYYIHCFDEDYFMITEGPKVHGLDKLIEFYIEGANHLPTRLTNLCKGILPPAKVRKEGPTNLLHTAVEKGRVDVTLKILKHHLCPDVDSKNEAGYTALHLATNSDMAEAVSLLLSKGADVNIKDPDGATPLFTACMNNSVKSAKILVSHAPSCVHEKSPVSGWVPLHAAAMCGHTQCAKILLDVHAALFPRGWQKETPLDVTEKYRRNRCHEFLENYTEKLVLKSTEAEWLHPELDREGAENLFSQSSKKEGLFVVRKSRTAEGHYVLSVCDGTSLFHYAIQKTVYRGETMYYMDDGPFHRSLALLVQYYHMFADGLATILVAPVTVVPVLDKDEDPAGQDYQYSSCPSPSIPPSSPTRAAPQPAPFRPKLPPRPADLDSPPSSAEPPTNRKSSSTGKDDETAQQQDDAPEEEMPLREISHKDLKLGREIGKGEYGSVVHGILTVRRSLFARPSKQEVAIKMFHSVGNKEDFLGEARVMQQLKNDYIVELKGICYDKCLMLVEEFLPMGSMLDFLEEHPEKVRVERELYVWAAQIAKGMMYLESKRLVHRDLAARNILLASLQKVKISDFGLSRAMGTDKEYYKASKGGRWPIKWYAPESVCYGHFSRASDVWSYGVTLWEMFSYGAAPFEEMTGVEVIKFIEDGNRLAQPQKCPDVVYTTMLRCWSWEPADRPTFSWLDQHFDTEETYVSARDLLKAVGRS
ncbi:tyrosine-protein kinase [Elysia marginata]|uniref:Tyrosine-protein kinase n=1 Tax=Elysia marginata TaxID=1093978 RepID=A0AAV4K1P4_9GAST|nr:tyrosine-protein kinase [Elysia marginata]